MRNIIRSSLPQEIKNSLTYCWKEGIAAQVMITIIDYYLIPFALFIGASVRQIGLLVAIPNFLSALSQIFAVKLVHLTGSRHKTLVYTIGIQVVLLIPFVFLPFLPIKNKIVILILLMASYRVLGSLAGPAWGSLVSHYLHDHQRGQYLGWRSRVVSITGVINTAFWGWVLYLMKFVSQEVGFIIIFFCAVVARIVSFYLIRKMTDVPITHPDPNKNMIQAFLHLFRERNFLKFICFVTTVTFATQFSQPFFSVHMLKDLRFDYLKYMSVHLSSIVGSIIAFPLWGRNADIAGNARVIKSTGILLPLIPFLWSLAQNPYQLIPIELLSGFLWSGFSLSTTNFIYDSTSPSKRVSYLGYYNFINSAAVFTGATLGGFLAERMPLFLGFRLGTLFLISSSISLMANLFLSRHFSEIRASTKKVSSVRLYWSVIGIRPLAGQDVEPEIYPDIRPPREVLGKAPRHQGTEALRED